MIEPEPAPPTVRLHSLNAVTLASFLGGPLGGGVVLAINESRLGSRAKAWQALGAGAAIAATLIGLGFALPDAALRGAGPVSVFAMRGLGQWLQGPRLEAHEKSGGPIVTMWAAAGIGLASLVATLGVLFVCLLPTFFAEATVHKHVVGTGAVLYAGSGVSEADAAKLGDALHEVGFFTDGPQNVLLLKEDRTLSVRFFMNPGSWDEADTVKSFQALRDRLAAKVFADTALEVALCDPEGEIRKRLR